MTFLVYQTYTLAINQGISLLIWKTFTPLITWKKTFYFYFEEPSKGSSSILRNFYSFDHMKKNFLFFILKNLLKGPRVS